MSQQPPPSGGRYARSSGGLVGAMVVLVAAVVAFVLLNNVFNAHDATPVRTVDWHSWVQAGRSDDRMQVLAPQALPSGWRATSASYVTGTSPDFHLGMLTSGGKFVGVEESLSSSQDMVDQYVDENATKAADPRLMLPSGAAAGSRWEAWRDSGGDYAVVLVSPEQTVLVVGSAPEAQVRAFAATLRTG